MQRTTLEIDLAKSKAYKYMRVDKKCSNCLKYKVDVGRISILRAKTGFVNKNDGLRHTTRERKSGNSPKSEVCHTRSTKQKRETGIIKSRYLVWINL